MHRPKYDDWSWAKGKLDPGEEWPVAAARETQEETGLRVHLGMPAALCGLHRARPHGRAGDQAGALLGEPRSSGGTGHLENEIDEVRWLDVVAAHDRLDYARDREQLRAVVRADAAGRLTTWPLALVRHAKARPRGTWKGPDPERPLDARGAARAGRPGAPARGLRHRPARLVRLHPVRRDPPPVCRRDRAAAAAAGRPLRGGVCRRPLPQRPPPAAGPSSAGAPTALCSHGPVLPDLLRAGLPGRPGRRRERVRRCGPDVHRG